MPQNFPTPRRNIVTAAHNDPRRGDLQKVLSCEDMTMDRASINRDQFDIGPQGIVHTPTAASFTPDPANANSGIVRLGQLANWQPNTGNFAPDDVCRQMTELWLEYVANSSDA
jgi:hypothetical protein